MCALHEIVNLGSGKDFIHGCFIFVLPEDRTGQRNAGGRREGRVRWDAKGELGRQGRRV